MRTASLYADPFDPPQFPENFHENSDYDDDDVESDNSRGLSEEERAREDLLYTALYNETSIEISDPGIDISPLLAAANDGNVEAIQFFLNHGIPLDDRDSASATGLHWALYSGNPKALAVFLDRGLSINVRDNAGATALHYAARGGHYKMAAYLIKRGANVNARTNKTDSYITPIYEALDEGKDNIVRLLVRSEARLNIRAGDTGGTPLEFAIARNKPGLVRLFIQKGARLDPDSPGFIKALQSAQKYKKKKVISLLKKIVKEKCERDLSVPKPPKKPKKD